jgi:phosphate transport system protein
MDIINQHTSQQFNVDLEGIRNKMMEMGGLVEKQITNAIEVICTGEVDKLCDIDYIEDQIDEMEVAIDNECTQILVRRQPAASDLRMVIAVSRVIGDLERMGDEASKIAKLAMSRDESSNSSVVCQHSIRYMGIEVVKMLKEALDAFARYDVNGAVEVVRNDKLVDQQYASAVRELVTYMMEDPRAISGAIEILWALRSIERIGDHARNISEQVIYLVNGKDVRHSSLMEIEKEAKH